MSATPLVSVLLASRNGARLLPRALEGLAAQTYPAVEIVAVDDGSSDDTHAVLSAFAARHGRMRVLATSGLGAGPARNLAAANATGELLAVHDDDDRSHPERLARQVAFLGTHPRIAVVGSDADVLDESDRVVGRYGVPIGAAAIRRVARRDPPFVHGSVTMRRAAFEAAGGYRAAFRLSEDLDLFLRLPVAGFANLPERLYAWRRHDGGSASRAREAMLDYAAAARWFAAQRRASGRDEVERLAAAGSVRALLEETGAAGLALELAIAYARHGRGAAARAFARRALSAGAPPARALAALALATAVELTPRGARGRAATRTPRPEVATAPGAGSWR
ncbi:MAG TPA: glycosyltransferase family A protein [Candidatus Acidoferrales bacterium]|nr:glycosyltransferase family A protein [Candidatus Acidoferrales bacterium]